jgi:hypothetical protein
MNPMITRRDTFRLALGVGSLRILTAQGAKNLPVTALYYGRQDPLPEVIALQAGPVSAIFDIETASLRYVRVADQEVVRTIYAAVRDSDWGTVEPRLHGLRVTTSERGFEVAFTVDCVRPPYDFVWNGKITGDPAGTIRFTFDGQARSTFFRNRLGFAVLHPIRGVAGKPARVRKSGNVTESGNFPDLISPHQPFFEMRSVAHQVKPGLEAEVRFEGEVFEMEDHRNWTDASFKTYCTPLALPYPVEVKQGAKVTQAIEIRFKGELPSSPRRSRTSPAPVAVTVDAKSSQPVPRIGFGAAHHGQALSAREIARLKALAPAHLRVDCRFARGTWKDDVNRALGEAASVGAALEVAAHLPENAFEAAGELAAVLSATKVPLAGVLLYRADAKASDDAWLAPIRKALGSARLATGTDDGFVQINRNRPEGSGFDAVCYSINPQVHAIDNMTMVENLEAQADTVRSARAFAAGKPVWISPVTLKMRYNPNARGPAAEVPEGMLPPSVDARQMSLFGAGWTLGSLGYLAGSGAERITYFETTGWRGVIETEKGSGLEDKFPSVPGGVFPLYHVFADLAPFAAKGRVISSDVDDPLRVSALVLRLGSRWRILLANHTHEVCPVRLSGLPRATGGVVRRINAESAMAAMSNPEAFRRPVLRAPMPQVLAPYEIVTIDLR